jgi:hypothetical protein
VRLTIWIDIDAPHSLGPCLQEYFFPNNDEPSGRQETFAKAFSRRTGKAAADSGLSALVSPSESSAWHCLSVHPSVRRSVCLRLSPSESSAWHCLSVHPSVRLSVCLSILSVCLSVGLTVCLSVCLLVHPTPVPTALTVDGN